MKFLISNTATTTGSNEMAVFENKPMSNEAIKVIYKLGMSAIIGAVCIAAISATGWVAVAVIGCLSDDKRYRGGFIARCYSDARNHSRLGTPYTETAQRDYEEVMAYIDKWEPEVTFNGMSGARAYKEYLDIRAEEKRSFEDD